MKKVYFFKVEVEVRIGEEDQGINTVYVLSKTKEEYTLDERMARLLDEMADDWGYSKVFSWTPLKTKPKVIQLEI